VRCRFWTWRSLCIQQGLSDREAADAMTTSALTTVAEATSPGTPACGHSGAESLIVYTSSPNLPITRHDRPLRQTRTGEGRCPGDEMIHGLECAIVPCGACGVKESRRIGEGEVGV
jgi:hypothetical protein